MQVYSLSVNPWSGLSGSWKPGGCWLMEGSKLPEDDRSVEASVAATGSPTASWEDSSFLVVFVILPEALENDLVSSLRYRRVTPRRSMHIFNRLFSDFNLSNFSLQPGLLQTFSSSSSSSSSANGTSCIKQCITSKYTRDQNVNFEVIDCLIQ